jgi:hypothetical protein
MRGPVTALIILGVTTILRRLGSLFGAEYTALVPISMVALIVVLEYSITIFSPIWERILFYGSDFTEVELLTEIGDRLMTRADLQQFLELALGAVSDKMQAMGAFVAAMVGGSVDIFVHVGVESQLTEEVMEQEILPVARQQNGQDLFRWGKDLILPLFNDMEDKREIIGLLGLNRLNEDNLDAEQMVALHTLANRIGESLRDRQIQKDLYAAIENLNPQIENFQRMRMAARFGTADEFLKQDFNLPSELVTQVKEEMTHYWGGPTLSNSPLAGLMIVKAIQEKSEGSPTNAIRAILRRAVDQVKPAGERKFTSEWILYNILEMKFMEGKKVREVALKLAMSEADLYRKQRVAVEAVAKAILNMENNSGERKEVYNIQD